MKQDNRTSKRTNQVGRRHFFKMLLYIGISLSIFTSCQKENGEEEDKASAAKTFLNVSYGSNAAQIMDVYLPAGRTMVATKAIVLIHGGSWNAGSKADLAQYIDTFKKRTPDFAIFNIGYRLASPATTFPTQEQDVKSAFDFIAANAETYGFNKEKVAILGVSAGAHLALLQAYKQTSPVKAKAVVDFFGPTDLTGMYNQPWHPLIPLLLQNVTGATPASNPELYRQSSPINFVTPQSSPTLILQGGMDDIVDPSQSVLLQQKLNEAGVVNEYVFYPAEGHGWFGATLVTSFDRIEAFLKKHVP